MDTLANYKYFDKIAPDYDKWKKKNWYYYDNLKKLFKDFIPGKKRVLDIGCGTGEILNAVDPSYGVGIDLSKNMIEIAKNKFPNLIFLNCAAEHIEKTVAIEKNFDYIIMSDIVEHLYDVQVVFRAVKNICSEETKIVISTPNSLWQPFLELGEKIHLKMPEGPHNWISLEILANIAAVSGFKVIKSGFRLPTPKKIPFLSSALEKVLPRVKLLRRACWISYIVMTPDEKAKKKDYSCSIIIPCKDEAENIKECIKKIPDIGRATEIIIIDDGSKDQTADLTREIIKTDKRVKLISYPRSRGKGHAVKEGFNLARGDVFIIFDADMAVGQEELVKFYDAINEQRCGFANGTRIIYPMEDQAMPLFNLLGNKMFSFLFTFALKQPITDTLCGTKAFLREDYLKMDFSGSSWGDFSLLLNAALLKLKILEIPVHYRKRRYGFSKMRPFIHGLMLLYVYAWMLWRIYVVAPSKTELNMK